MSDISAFLEWARGPNGVAASMARMVADASGFMACEKCMGRPAPSATAEPLILRPQGHVIPGVPVPFTESERAFLRLFVRDYLAQVDLPAGLVRGADTVAAARDLLAEGEP